jgi:sugar O-acyltransferase (sialic acid O-acetyltransferase NeuD family)
MKHQIILIGAGGHCISAIDVLEQSGLYEIVGILDLQEKVGGSVMGYPIIGTDDKIEYFSNKGLHFLITVGQIERTSLREILFKKIKAVGGKLPFIISPLAYVSKHAELDEGTIVMHHSLVNAKVKIGKCCIINSKALIEHETVVGDFCHVSTGTILNGQVVIGSQCFIGSKTVVVNNIHVCSSTTIAASSHVLKNIYEPGTYLGRPLLKIR